MKLYLAPASVGRLSEMEPGTGCKIHGNQQPAMELLTAQWF